jgi:hypothetical protein
MDVPESLPARLFLLAYDLRKQRMTARMEITFPLMFGPGRRLPLRRRLPGNGAPPRTPSQTTI